MPPDVQYADEMAKRVHSNSDSCAFSRKPHESVAIIKAQAVSNKDVDDIDKDDRDIRRKQVKEN